MTKELDLDLLSSYNFELPERLIAQSPAAQREEARLLVVRKNPEKGMPRFEDLKVSDLPWLLSETPSLRSLLWMRNISKVLPARFYGLRLRADGSQSFSRHEIVFIEQEENTQFATALIRGTAKMHFPQKLKLEKAPEIEIEVLSENRMRLMEGSSLNWKALLWKIGEMPLPPYIKDRDPERDQNRYQSIWAENEKDFSVAAPTASLHFSESLWKKLLESGVNYGDLSLHVGLGTFEPVRVERLSEHKMHSECMEVSGENLKKIKSASSGVLSIGTTALRALESLEKEDLSSDFCFRRTNIFIKPGYQFKYTKALWTNFHLPESTLFVLISAFADSLALAKEAYAHAVAKNYRFFSYGDASLWF